MVLGAHRSRSIRFLQKGRLLHRGSLHNPKFEGTTYDYLKTNPLFDTLVLLIDKTGLKEEINAAGGTFSRLRTILFITM